MTITDVIDRRATSTSSERTPLVTVWIDLASSMQVRMRPNLGEVPTLDIVTGRVHMVVSLNLEDVADLAADHVAIAEQFAAAACAWRDEIRGLAEAKCVIPFDQQDRRTGWPEARNLAAAGGSRRRKGQSGSPRSG